MLEVQVREGAMVYTKRGAMAAYRGKLKFEREGMSDSGFKLAMQKALTGEGAKLMKVTAKAGPGRVCH
jgi:uncharacterized protein (AIM24 family)